MSSADKEVNQWSKMNGFESNQIKCTKKEECSENKCRFCLIGLPVSNLSQRKVVHDKVDF